MLSQPLSAASVAISAGFFGEGVAEMPLMASDALCFILFKCDGAQSLSIVER